VDTPQAGNPAPRSRAARFLGRIDALLPSLGNDRARRSFLDHQMEAWERRYSRFIASEGASEITHDPADPPQAADLLLTIAGLAQRRSALTPMRGEIRMAEHDRKQRIEHALRSLLVCADQCCPAIIGQAHVLYHDAIGGSRSNVEQRLSDLKREAEDLLAAIGDAEAQMHAARHSGP
jgi:hypothetical protein